MTRTNIPILMTLAMYATATRPDPLPEDREHHDQAVKEYARISYQGAAFDLYRKTSLPDYMINKRVRIPTGSEPRSILFSPSETIRTKPGIALEDNRIKFNGDLAGLGSAVFSVEELKTFLDMGFEIEGLRTTLPFFQFEAHTANIHTLVVCGVRVEITPGMDTASLQDLRIEDVRYSAFEYHTDDAGQQISGFEQYDLDPMGDYGFGERRPMFNPSTIAWDVLTKGQDVARSAILRGLFGMGTERFLAVANHTRMDFVIAALEGSSTTQLARESVGLTILGSNTVLLSPVQDSPTGA